MYFFMHLSHWFKIKFSRFILESSHIAAGPFESSFWPIVVLFTLHINIKPSKMAI